MAEGNYGGIYSESPDHEPILYHYQTNLKVLETALQGDLSHHRIVQFVKESGVWFVLDVMEADRPRTYRQQWWMSKLTEKNPDGYMEEWVSADADKGMFYSHADSMANVSMYHVGPVLLETGTRQTRNYNPVSTYIKQEEWYKGFRADRKQGVEFLHLTTDWHSEAGRSQLITVIYPRRQGQSEEDLQVERTDNGREVTVTTNSGDRIHFVADGLESTLTVRKAGEETERGLVLTQSESYEFTRHGKSEDHLPIYRPIGELLVSPNVSAFADEITVSMSAVEDDIEIRYTTDGSDPTLQSPLYTGGLVLSASTTLKARGFRRGLKEMPANRAGNTLMSRVYRASYVKDPAHERLPDEFTGKLQHGLKYSYYEDKWPKLLFGAPLSEVNKTGTVVSAFDTSPGSGKEDQAFAFRYEGYFKAPEDGVYTLFAPEEFYKYNPLAGYDLDVHFGYQRRWHQGVKVQVGPDTPLQQWYPGTRRHALGTWSVFLKKGYHPLRIYFADIRPGGYLEYMHHKYDGVNVPGLIKRYWDGDVPELEIAGPGIERQRLPSEYLYH